VENAPGYKKAMDVYSYDITLQGWQASEKLKQTIRVVKKNNERRRITVRTLRRRHLKADLQIFRQIYNRAWDDNWGFVPLSDDELDALIKDLGQYVESRLGIFAAVDDRPVAFLLAFPDLNQPLHYACSRPGKPDLLSMIQVFWHWKIRPKINRVRIALMGVQDGYRGIGVEAAMFVELFEQALKLTQEKGWTHADAGWVLETNEPMSRLVEGYSGDDYKHYRFYERALSSAAPPGTP
jgi:GNAT superfamily N-acetyltransferase